MFLLLASPPWKYRDLVLPAPPSSTTLRRGQETRREVTTLPGTEEWELRERTSWLRVCLTTPLVRLNNPASVTVDLGNMNFRWWVVVVSSNYL